MNVHKRFLLRELMHGWRHGLIFILCVALSLMTMVALNSFKKGVNNSLFRDARELHGGDIILHSHYPLSLPLLHGVQSLEERGQITSTKTYEFYSVVRNSEQESTLLARIKAVDVNFPLYGKVELASGDDLQAVLSQGSCVVAADVLTRLNLEKGESLKVGGATLRIADVVVHESDRPVNILNFGPRVFVHHDDLDTIDLVKKGSRVKYEMLLKVSDQGDLGAITAQLRKLAIEGQERVNTFREEGSGIKRFFDNLLFFLSLISIFTLLLAGLGMQSCLTALLRQKRNTIAVARTVGATSSFIYQNYLLMVVLLGLIGAVAGIGGGLILGTTFPYLFKELLPIHGFAAISPADLGEGLSLGAMVVFIFTFLPLHDLRKIKPVAIFRRERREMAKDIFFYLATAAGVAMVSFLVVRQLEDQKIGMYFMAGVIALLLITGAFASLLLKGAEKLMVQRLSLRQALRSMTRAGNATRSIIITLASALSLLFAIYLVEHNLHLTYVESYPQGAPNLFCLDIQPDQRQGFTAFFDEKPQLFPIIRARLMAINGEPVNRAEERKKKRDNFAREFNLTYRDSLLDDEVLIQGKSLFRKAESGNSNLQVSILDSVAEMGDIEINDILLFNIQGVEMEAQVVSMRSRTKSKLYPFFYFVFPGDRLKSAPQTFFSAVRIDSEKIASLQNSILDKYPNISFINVSETAKDVEVLMQKLTAIVNFFASFSILAGCLILISSILATRMARTRESVYYKILGSKSSFVYRIFFYENMLIGLFSSVVALVLAQCGSWAICHYLFEIEYDPAFGASVLLVFSTLACVVLTGIGSSLAIVRQKPARFLREHGNG